MRMSTVRKIEAGTAGWLGLAAAVVAWDLLAPETLSSAFRRSRTGPVRRVVIGAAWAVLTAHLFEVFPPEHDPLHIFMTHGRLVVRRG